MAMVGELMEVILYVQDMGAQVSFYRDTLGLNPVAVWMLSSTVFVPARQAHSHCASVGRVTASPDRSESHSQKATASSHETMGEVRSPAPGVQVCDGLDPEGNKFSIESHAE